MARAGQFDPAAIGFRFLTAADLPQMLAWFKNPAVRAWYHDGEETLEDVQRTYGDMLDGQSNVLAFVATYAGAPVGYVQRYLTRDHPDYWVHQGFPDDTAGIDLFIGEDAFRGRGFGPLLIRAFLSAHVFADPGIGRCIIDPVPENAAAIRAYEKAGFRYLRTIGPPEHVEPAHLMVLERAEFAREEGDRW